MTALDTGFNRPTLQALIDRIESDFNTRIPGADSRLRRSVLNVLARVLANLSHGLYGYLDFISRQAFTTTADLPALEIQASEFGIQKRAAAKATGTITITGANGSFVSTGQVLRTADEIEYTTTSAVTVASGTASPTVEAVVAGEGSNLDASTSLTFVSPIVGVDAVATSGAITGGEDEEDAESLRARILARKRQPPMGGAEYDYEAWALEIAGVTRVWVDPQALGAGTVTVRFMTDDLTGNGIPTGPKVIEVDTYLQTKRPVTCDLTTLAPTAVPLAMGITLKDAAGATVTDTTVQAEVTAELRDMLLRDASPGGTILISRIREAISIAAGEYDHVLTTPAANVTHTAGQIATLGTITYAS